MSVFLTNSCKEPCRSFIFVPGGATVPLHSESVWLQAVLTCTGPTSCSFKSVTIILCVQEVPSLPSCHNYEGWLFCTAVFYVHLFFFSFSFLLSHCLYQLICTAWHAHLMFDISRVAQLTRLFIRASICNPWNLHGILIFLLCCHLA